MCSGRRTDAPPLTKAGDSVARFGVRGCETGDDADARPRKALPRGVDGGDAVGLETAGTSFRRVWLGYAAARLGVVGVSTVSRLVPVWRDIVAVTSLGQVVRLATGGWMNLERHDLSV